MTSRPLPLQLAAMRDYVAKRGWKPVLEVQDIGSSAGLLQGAFQQRNHLVLAGGLTCYERRSPRRETVRNYLELLAADTDVTKSCWQAQLRN
jgi:hypothetical protein